MMPSFKSLVEFTNLVLFEETELPFGYNKHSFNKGIKKTINWYKNNKSWLSEIKKKYKDKRLGSL